LRFRWFRWAIAVDAEPDAVDENAPEVLAERERDHADCTQDDPQRMRTWVVPMAPADDFIDDEDPCGREL